MAEHILSLSYGKDSIACIEAIKQLGLPLDRIVHAEVWATDTIPADLPPMVEFKAHANKIIKARYGIEVEHVCAQRDGTKLSYDRQFYTKYVSGGKIGEIYGFPMPRGSWCNGRLKVNILDNINKNAIKYLGIAADEPERIKRHTKKGVVLPLVEIGWDEAHCRQWCADNDLLSPIYTTVPRGGCWFCHNQGTDQLRLLRKNYPDLWALLLKWDADSPTTFKPDGHTVHDHDRRFAAEDAGRVPTDRRFRWAMLDAPEQLTLF